MSTAVLPLVTLAPFAIIVGVMLAVFYVTTIVEGYEAPKSASDSLKRIVVLTGGWMGGFLVAQLFSNGLEFSEEIWASLLGAVTAILILFAIDMLVLRLRAKRRNETGGDA